VSFAADSATLLRLVPTDGSTIGDTKLRQTLRWDEERYANVRDALVWRRVLAIGKAGWGDGVMLSEVDTQNASRVGEKPPRKKAPPPAPVKKAADKSAATHPPIPARFPPHRMFEQAFKNIDDVLWKDAGCTSELDYTEQSSWLLFLKYLDSLETDKATEAELEGKKYSYILDPDYRWSKWAAPKTKGGEIDHNKALTGDDLRDFVNLKLCPYLHGFKQRASGPNTIEYKIGEIFGEIRNKIQSGYNLREIIDHVDELQFGSQKAKHELSHLYEAKIKNMGNAGRNGGEYYTPRPLIRAVIHVLKPQIGETIYDGACGSAGFHCESFDYLKSTGKLTTKDLKTLQTRTFFGKEKKSLAYVIGIMNMILHGIEAPNIVHTNTLTENLADIQEKDRYDIVMANPPFGGKERPEVQQNFPIRTGETAFLFLQHFIKILRAGGRGGIVIKNTFLSNTDNASVS
jgi:type I restriction enzyme M protein